MELIKKATKSMNDLRGGLTFTKDAKLVLATLLEDIIESMKQRVTVTPPENAPTTARIETFEAATQTDKTHETHVDIGKTQLDEIQDSIAELMALTTANSSKVNELKYNMTTSCDKIDENTATLEDLKDAITSEAGGERTLAQIVATTQAASPQQVANPQRKERIQKARKNEALQEVTLTFNNAPESAINLIQNTKVKDIAARLASIIDAAELPGKPTLTGVSRLGIRGIRLHVTTEEGANEVRKANIDWNMAYAGLATHKPKYGVVIHRVPTNAINFDEDISNVKEEWGRENGIQITNITPLRKSKDRHKPNAAHKSIVIYTENPAHADKCLTFGFFIEREKFSSIDKFAPHLHLNQCFKCQKYGHRSTTCKAKHEKCGKCAKDHPTAECTTDAGIGPECANCGGRHEAWHNDCPTRQSERERLKARRLNEMPFYLA
jgi:hypothetical protein